MVLANKYDDDDGIMKLRNRKRTHALMSLLLSEDIVQTLVKRLRLR